MSLKHLLASLSTTLRDFVSQITTMRERSSKGHYNPIISHRAVQEDKVSRIRPLRSAHDLIPYWILAYILAYAVTLSTIIILFLIY